MKLFLSIIIPAYNEKENFKKGALRKVAAYLSKVSYSYEVIIVDDGSTDETVKLIKEFIKDKKNWQLQENIHQGKAATIAKGVSLAQGQNILFTDFDQATPLKEVEKLLPFLKKGKDIIIGSREIKGAKREKEPFYRHLMGKGFNLIVRLLISKKIYDTQCGFKLFKAKVAKELFSKLQVYGPKKMKGAFTGAFDVEILYLAEKNNYQISEVPIFWSYYQTTRVSPIKDSIKMFLDVIKISLYNIFGRYEKK